jgi:hypothetical protein
MPVMPRSGTTLVEQILASRPMIHSAGELRRLQTRINGNVNIPASVPSLAAPLHALGEA